MLKNKFQNGKIKLSLSLALILTLSVPLAARADNTNTASPSNKSLVYMQIINFAMPLMKSVSFSEDDIAEYHYSLKDEICKSLGINMSSPLSVIGKELSFLKSTDDEPTHEQNVNAQNITPYNINKESIIKNVTDPSNTSVPENAENLPDNKVSEAFNSKLVRDKLNSAKPEVLIYHTHTLESYKPSDNDNEDPSKNVCAVGDVITNELVNNYKIGVIHDKTVHNAILYNRAYARSGETLDKYLKQYDDFKLIIDLHRDASTDGKAVTVKLNGTNMARIEFVIGKANKSANKNIAITKDIIGISQNLFPGLVRQTNSNDFGIYYWNSYFNQNKSSNAILLEVGNEINTLDEAKASGTYIARIIAEYLNKKR